MSGSLAVEGQTASSAAPSLKKETKKALDKGGQNAYKHCSAEPDKDAAIVAGSCLDLAFALRNQVKDIDDARVALQRSCSLGNPGGCNELGKDLDSRGGHTAAVELWLGPTCGNASFCRASLFYSLSSFQPLDRPRIVEIGMPLCDAGGDDQVCARLAQLGVQADYAAIAQRHREQKIEQLRTSIQNEDQLARSYEDGANQLQQQQTSGSLAALVNATGVSGMKITAQNHRNKADSMRSELSRLTGQPLEIPASNFVAQHETPTPFHPLPYLRKPEPQVQLSLPSRTQILVRNPEAESRHRPAHFKMFIPTKPRLPLQRTLSRTLQPQPQPQRLPP